MESMLGERLALARKRAGLDQVDMAVAMGDRYNQQMVSAVEHGRSGIRLDGLVNAAKELDVSTDWLLGLTDDPRPSNDLLVQINSLARTASERRAGRASCTGRADDTNPDGAYRPVKILEVASTAGGGAAVYDETPVGVLWFREDWLRSRGIDSDLCHIISVVGDSMAPTLPAGCSILVDRSRSELHNRRIYVMRNEEGLIVKRVRHSPQHGWLLISDNISWPIEVMDSNTSIIGEVKWYAMSL